MFKFTDDKGRNFFLNIRKEQVKSITNNDVEGCCCITFYDDGGEKWSCVKGTTDEVYAYIFGEKKKRETVIQFSDGESSVINLTIENTKLKAQIEKLTQNFQAVQRNLFVTQEEKKELEKRLENQSSNIRALQDRNKQLEETANRVEDMLTGKCITIISMS